MIKNCKLIADNQVKDGIQLFESPAIIKNVNIIERSDPFEDNDIMCQSFYVDVDGVRKRYKFNIEELKIISSWDDYK